MAAYTNMPREINWIRIREQSGSSWTRQITHRFRKQIHLLTTSMTVTDEEDSISPISVAEPTWCCGHYWPIVPAPGDRWWWLWSNWWNEDWQGKLKYSEKTCPSATLSTTNPTRPEPGSNPGRRGGKPATNRVSYGEAAYRRYYWGNVHFSHISNQDLIRVFRACHGNSQVHDSGSTEILTLSETEVDSACGKYITPGWHPAEIRRRLDQVRQRTHARTQQTATYRFN
jgi:hypothetical protein